MLKKNAGLVLSVITTSIIMLVLKFYFVSRLSGGFIANLFKCVVVVVVIILIPYLVMFSLLFKTSKTRAIYQSIIIGIVAASMMTGLQLFVPFRTGLDYLSVFIAMGSGFAFPLLLRYFDKKMLNGDLHL